VLAKPLSNVPHQCSTKQPHLFHLSHSLSLVRHLRGLIKQQLEVLQQSSAVHHLLALAKQLLGQSC
jgi:hypothetical protein